MAVTTVVLSCPAQVFEGALGSRQDTLARCFGVRAGAAAALCERAESRGPQRGHPRLRAPDKDGGYESYTFGEFIVTNLGFAQ